MQTDQQQHVFCRIKHQEKETITSRSEFVSGEYLSSAAIKEYYEKKAIDNRPKTNANILHIPGEYNPTSSAHPAYLITAEDGTVCASNDTVLCVKVILEKEVKDSFMGRCDRNKWPWNQVENWEELLIENVYAIPKPDPDDSETGHLRWRLSFSVVEIRLALLLTEIQKRCYRVLKALIKFNVNEGLQEDEKFPSYYLKTLMFWLCENSSTDSWTIQNLARHWLRLLDSVIEKLEKKTLPHYFVSSYNLLDGKPQDYIDHWLQRLKQIRQKPLKAVVKFFDEYMLANLSEIDWGFFFTSFLKQATRYLEKKGLPLQLFRESCAYLLTKNFLSDFITSLKHHPQMKLIDVSRAQSQSQEHVIWIYYMNLWKLFPRFQFTGDHASLWTYLAELVHHMVLKYGDQVYDKNLFNTRTAEWFHLIACNIQSTTHAVNNINDNVRYIKYANFLRAEKRYMEAVQVLINICHKGFSGGYCYISKVTSEVLDVWSKLELVLSNELHYSQRRTTYHLLTCCYAEAGILAEVHIPDYTENKLLPGIIPEEYFFSVNQATLGCQLLLAGNLQKALKCFAQVKELKLQNAPDLIKNMKFLGMAYIVARYYTEHMNSISPSKRSFSAVCNS